MSSVIFSGSNVKTLKRDILASEAGVDYAGFLFRSGVDPRSSATSGNRGTLLIDVSNARIYKKLDTGSSTNWVLISSNGSHRLSFLEYGNSPVQSLYGTHSVYLYAATLAQELYSEYSVPNTYTAGEPLTVKAKIFSLDTSGTVLIRAQATLVRQGVDDILSTTNQRTTTNAAITMSAANDGEIQVVDLDITDSSGQINGVAVSPSDFISIRVYRDTDTATGDIYLLHKQVEVI